MGRLLDEDDVIDAVQQHREGVLGGYEYDEGVAFVYAAAHNHIIEVIKQLPSAQPYIVRCDECIYFRAHRDQSDFCVNWNATVDDIYGFCSKGKR